MGSGLGVMDGLGVRGMDVHSLQESHKLSVGLCGTVRLQGLGLHRIDRVL